MNIQNKINELNTMMAELKDQKDKLEDELEEQEISKRVKEGRIYYCDKYDYYRNEQTFHTDIKDAIDCEPIGDLIKVQETVVYFTEEELTLIAEGVKELEEEESPEVEYYND